MNMLLILDFLLKYSPLLSAAVILVGGLVASGVFRQRFSQLESSMSSVLISVQSLNSCVDELQTILRNRNKGMNFTKETIGIYGRAKSPIVLKDEFRELVQETGLQEQITQNKEALVRWLREKNPETGLDAQGYISDLIVTEEVDAFLDTKAFKEYLYEHGKSAQDYYGILMVYLFETIIPEVLRENTNVESANLENAQSENNHQR